MAFGSYLRSGDASDSAVRAILESLNRARGTAYDTDRGSAVWAENYAFAKAIADVWLANERLAKQFDPSTIGVYLSRWEKMLGITPKASATLAQRKSLLARRMAYWSKEPVTANVDELLSDILGDVYVEINHTSVTDDTGYVPDGPITLPGGATLADGDWKSNISYVAVRVWQPLQGVNQQAELSDALFYNVANSFKPELDRYLPAYTTFEWYRFTIMPTTETIDIGAGSDVLGGVGTSWATGVNPFVAGEEIELVDESGNRRSVYIDSVNADDEAVLTQVQDYDANGRYYARKGVFLDLQNLDNAAFDQ
jgi:hypothetical protein